MSGDRYARSVHRGARRRRGGRQRSRPLAIVFAGLRTRYVVLSRTSLSFRLPSASPVSLALVSGKGGTRISWRSSSCAYLRSTHIRILSIIRVHIYDICITLIKYTQILTYTRIAFYVLPSVPERFFSLLSLDPALAIVFSTRRRPPPSALLPDRLVIKRENETAVARETFVASGVRGCLAGPPFADSLAPFDIPEVI